MLQSEHLETLSFMYKNVEDRQNSPSGKEHKNCGPVFWCNKIQQSKTSEQDYVQTYNILTMLKDGEQFGQRRKCSVIPSADFQNI